MARRKTPRSDQSSIKYRFNPQEGPFFEVADFELEDYASHPSHDNKQSSRKSESMSYKVVSTAEFISAVGQIWSCANYSLGVFQRKENMRSEGNGGPPSSSKGQYVSPNLMAASDSPPMVHNLECINVTQKISFFEPPRGNCKHSLFGRFLEGGSNMSSGTLKGTGLVNVGVSYDLENMYGWMSEKTLAGLRHLVGSTQIAKKQSGESSVFQDTSSPSSCCLTGATIAHANKSVTECTDSKDSSSGQTMRPIMNTSTAITSLCSDYFLEPVQEIEVNGSISRKMSSGLHEDYHVSSLALGGCALGDHENNRNEENEFIIEDEANMEICSSIRDHENKRNEENEFIIDDEANMEICSSIRDKPRHALAKQEHAFAGAFAGVFVSMCLHPVDTIKTVVQSCHADQKSIGYISRSIISERGVTGLYRGITSNIASSAPISAVYTFTYESVKGALLPLFPKEYYSFAHCVAGGCASIATSFIFTPSERIKQQLQVGSHYQNCWNALVGIIERGGLSSLYAGWGAVLCRNVPHSIIKFYTYESLKQLIVSSQPPNAQPNTLQTLVCGGLAGSTAALFTTPFDVVKTRLQTQIPGSVSRYDGVFNTLKGIAKHEGLRGLYRGLTPRLVMYMTQGALFFASYETFKRLLSSDVPLLNAQTIQYEKDMEDDSTLSSSLPSS